MMAKPDGGPAFPCSLEEFNSGFSGVSLRDYFAIKSLPLGGEFFVGIDDSSDPPHIVEHVARVAYAIADAMLKERGR